MNKTMKKVLTILSTLAIGAATVFSLGACTYNYKAFDGYTKAEAVESNGGWVVQVQIDGKKYVYFINGQPATKADEEGNTAQKENIFNKITRGALCRAEVKSDGSYGKTEMIVPLVVTGENYDAGIYVYGDYVYYATPTTAKNINGEIEEGYLDFKRSKLDGTETMKGYYFRASEATAQFRFVTVGDSVYCLHVDGSDLYSCKIDGEKGTDTLLVKGAGSYFFSQTDEEDPYVYYTMGVTLFADQASSVPQNYNQIYRVKADATSALKDGKISVTGSGEGYTYDYVYSFDVDSLQAQADKDKDDDVTFNKNKIEDYPYVNLGQPVLDGVGSAVDLKNSQYNHNVKDRSGNSVDGYKYTLLAYNDGGIYYTRQNCDKYTANESTTTYYFDASKMGKETDPAAMNKQEHNDFIGGSDTKASSSSFFYQDGTGHHYFYNESNVLMRKDVAKDGTETQVKQAYTTVVDYLFMADGYLYYTTASTEGEFVDVCRLKLTRTDYNTIFDGKDNEVNIFRVQHVSSWYAPEIIDGAVYFLDTMTPVGGGYPMAKSFKGMDDASIKAETEKVADDEEILFEQFGTVNDSNFQAAATLITYFYYTNGGLASDDYKVTDLKNPPYFAGAKNEVDLIDEVLQDMVETAKENNRPYAEDNTTFKFAKEVQDCVNAYLDGKDYTFKGVTFKFSKLNYKYYGQVFQTIGMADTDKDVQAAEHDAWKGYLGGVADDDSLPTWAWVLIWVGVGVGALAIVCGVTIPLVIHFSKKRKNTPRVARKKVVVDMNVDDSIDVYADENATTDAGAEEPNDD